MTTNSLTCTICSEYYKNNDEILCTNCGHVFHKSCLQNWQTRSKTCPECRVEKPLTQRIYLHIEQPNEAELKFLKLSDLVSQLERQVMGSERNLFDAQNALSAVQHQIKEMKKVEQESNTKIFNKYKEALAENKAQITKLLKTVQRKDEKLQKCIDEMTAIKLENIEKEKKIVQLKTKLETSNTESEHIILMLQEQLEINEKKINRLSLKK